MEKESSLLHGRVNIKISVLIISIQINTEAFLNNTIKKVRFLVFYLNIVLWCYSYYAPVISFF